MSWIDKRGGAAPMPCAVMMVAFALLIGGCQSGLQVARSTESFPAKTGFFKTEITLDEQTYPVWVFVPRDYTPQKRYPAILFLHGLFEAGTSGNKVLAAGLGPVIARDPERWPFITIFPQSPHDWSGEDKDRIAMGALDRAMRQWSIDPDRVILAGLSYGGRGTWEIGARHPDRFAALVPVSGISSADSVENLVRLSIWAFASKDDPWVHPGHSEEMCRAIGSLGGRARLTEFEGSAHDCWPQAAAGSSLVNWMLQQRRGQSLQTNQARALVFSPRANTQ